MDASTPVAHESQCDVCGYPRIGLPGEALCPECGEPPPRRAVETPRGSRRARHAPADAPTAGSLSHARAVGVGLLLLVVSSVSALSVTLVMDVGPMTIPALNVPAPKLHAAALVQRSIGGRPGPWGVSGTTAALLAVLGIWLVTTPRSLTADEEPALSLRRLARWTPIVAVGGALGLLLSGAEPYLYPRGDTIPGWIALMVLGCELPANGLVYAYLRRLSAEFGDRRASAALDRCAWAVPVATALAGAIIVYAAVQQSARATAHWPVSARVGAGVYAAAAMGAGAGATAGVLRLLGTVSAVAFSGWAARLVVMLGRLPRGVRRVIDTVGADPARWAVLSGLVLWIYQYRNVIEVALASPTRDGVFGRVPMLDFPGPKVPVAMFAGAASYRYGWIYDGTVVAPALWILGAVWLMTWPDVPGLRRAAAVWARRAVLALACLALAAGTMRQATVPEVTRHPRVVAFLVTGLSTVATALVYLRLSAVAAARGRRGLGRQLAVLGVTAAVLDLAPLGAFAFNPHDHHRSFAYGLVCAGQVAVTFVVTFFCLGALVRLIWALATERQASPVSPACSGRASDRPMTVTLPAIDRERLVRPRSESRPV
jgi:hypothetical protein